MVPCIIGFWKFCFAGIFVEFRENVVGNLLGHRGKRFDRLATKNCIIFRWDFVGLNDFPINVSQNVVAKHPGNR